MNIIRVNENSTVPDPRRGEIVAEINSNGTAWRTHADVSPDDWPELIKAIAIGLEEIHRDACRTGRPESLSIDQDPDVRGWRWIPELEGELK